MLLLFFASLNEISPPNFSCYMIIASTLGAKTCLDFKSCTGLLLGDIKGLWRLALVLSSVISIPLDEASVTERANSCLIVETTIVRLGET